MLLLATLGLCASCNKSADLTRGLVADYLSEGKTQDGRVAGASPAPDRLGHPDSAFSFNGADNSIVFSSVPLKQLDNWSLTAWLNPATNSQYAMAVCLGFDDGKTGDGFAFGMAADSYFPGNHLYGVLGGVAWIDSGYTFPAANAWYQVVMLRRGGITRFYVNGIQTPNSDSRKPLLPTAFTLGAATGTRHFNGIINDVRIYKRALSDAEVRQLYHSEMPPP